MIRKIVFLVEDTFNRRDYWRFGIDILLRNGFEVEVHDFSPVLNPKVWKTFAPPDPIEWEHYYISYTKKDMLSRISGLSKSSLVFNLLGYKLSTIGIFRQISKKNVPYATWFFSYPSYEALPSKGVLLKRIYDQLFHLIKGSTDRTDRLKILSNFIFSKIPFRYLGISAARLVVIGAEKYGSRRIPIDSLTEEVWAHTPDYDNCLEGNSAPILGDRKYGVFLDEYLPFHPDFISMGVKGHITADEYYPALCSFFDFVEKEYNTEIVIAASPRSDYDKHPDYFGGRKVIRDKTAQLVKYSNFVIMHHSASINFAVLYAKPITFITFDKMQEIPLNGTMMTFMSQMFSKPLINLSQGNPEKIDLLFIKKRAYEDYKRFYIKKEGTPEKPFWQIFADRVKCITDEKF